MAAHIFGVSHSTTLNIYYCIVSPNALVQNCFQKNDFFALKLHSQSLLASVAAKIKEF
jgi:hypothetical protein